MMNCALKEDGEPYGTQPAKIIPFPPQKERDYPLGPAAPALAQKPQIVVKRAKERHDPKLISELYKRFVAPFYPSAVRASRAFFIKHTIPYLMNVMCPEAVILLSLAFYNRHAGTFSDCGKESHTKQTMVAISRHTYPPLPPEVEATIQGLRDARKREAFRIMAHLSVKHPEFYMATRDMQARLLLPTSTTAHRLFERLCKLSLIERLSKGLNHRESKALGKRPSAATFRLKVLA